MTEIMHPEFSQRMQQACEGNPKVPPHNYGRLGWFVTEFESKFGVTVTAETIRKWFYGESKPRSKMMSQLAEILGVDEAWIALGKAENLTQKQRKIRNATADGAVNLVAGLIQMGGGHPAFPAKEGPIDLQAIIRGAMYNLHIALGEIVSKQAQFAVPVDATDCVVIGVIPTGDLSFRLIELDWEGITEVGKRTGASWDVSISLDAPSREWKQIRTFSERL